MRAGPNDAAEFSARAARNQSYQDHGLTGISAVQRAGWMAAHYAERWAQLLARGDVRLLLGPAANDYAVALPGERDSITGERQVQLWDWGGDLSGMLDEVLSLDPEAEYLVVRAYPSAFAEEQLRALGFAPELSRLVAPVVGRRSTGGLTIRPARSSDRLFMANLRSRGVEHYLPAGRTPDAEACAHSSASWLLNLDLAPTSRFQAYMLCQRARPLGYLLLQVGLRMDISGAQTAYLQDIGLSEAARGRFASPILVRHVMAELQESGHRFLVAEVAEGNQGALGVARRALRFELDYRRWGRRVD